MATEHSEGDILSHNIRFLLTMLLKRKNSQSNHSKQQNVYTHPCCQWQHNQIQPIRGKDKVVYQKNKDKKRLNLILGWSVVGGSSVNINTIKYVYYYYHHYYKQHIPLYHDPVWLVDFSPYVRAATITLYPIGRPVRALS